MEVGGAVVDEEVDEMVLACLLSRKYHAIDGEFHRTRCNKSAYYFETCHTVKMHTVKMHTVKMLTV